MEKNHTTDCLIDLTWYHVVSTNQQDVRIDIIMVVRGIFPKYPWAVKVISGPYIGPLTMLSSKRGLSWGNIPNYNDECNGKYYHFELHLLSEAHRTTNLWQNFSSTADEGPRSQEILLLWYSPLCYSSCRDITIPPEPHRLLKHVLLANVLNAAHPAAVCLAIVG